MANNNSESFHQVLDKMLQVHDKGGRHIKTIKCDQDFCSVMEDVVNDPGIDIESANAQDHVAAAEQNNGTIEGTICIECQQ